MTTYRSRSTARLSGSNTGVILALQLGLGVIYGLGFAPLSWWLTALVALTCHLIALRHLTRWYLNGLGGWLFGSGFFMTSLHWVQESFTFGSMTLQSLGWIAVLGLSLALGLFNGLFALLAHRLMFKGLLQPLMQAVLWTLVGWLRSSVLTGFPWNLAAYVWSDVLPMLQATAFIGVYGLGFLTVFLCTSLALLFAAGASRRAALVSVSAIVVVLTAFHVGGGRRLETSAELSTQFRVRLVQANIRQDRKWNVTERERILADYLEGTASAGNVPSLVVWPETAVPFLLDEDNARRALVARALPPGGHLVTGGHRRGTDGREQRFFNSVMAIASSGAVTGRYDKVHLVPFGKFIPFASLNPFPRLTASLSDLTAGSSHSTLNLGSGAVVAPLICYEAIFPGDLRALASDATAIVNVTNDAWFGMSWGPYQHLAIARVRAIELGLPLVRAANTGISAVFDPFGKSLAEIPLGVRAYADVDVPSPLPRRTTYAQIGDKPLFTLLSLVLVVSVISHSRRDWRASSAVSLD